MYIYIYIYITHTHTHVNTHTHTHLPLSALLVLAPLVDHFVACIAPAFSLAGLGRRCLGAVALRSFL